jgi:hypothetical protein
MCANTRLLTAVLLAVPLGARVPDAGRVSPSRLRCEYAVDAMGIDVATPRLFWQVESPDRGERQTAWQDLAASSPESLAANRGDLWESGRIESDETGLYAQSETCCTRARCVASANRNCAGTDLPNLQREAG